MILCICGNGCRSMTQARLAKTIVSRAAQSLIKTIIACIFVVSAMVGTVWACPKGDDAVLPLVATRQSATAIAIAIVSDSRMQTIGVLDRVDQGRCSSGCHCQTIGCGCCLASFASLNATKSSLFLSATSTRLLPFDQSEAPSARPPPDFRPPRTFI